MELSDIKKLSAILQENGDKILDGSSKLSISINLLQYLNESFNLVIDEKDQTVLGPPTIFQVIHTSNTRLEIFRDLQFLHDFIQKTVGLKISTNTNPFVIPPTEPFDGTADISKFRSLKLLEIRKVPVRFLTGIKHLRSQIQCINCVKSLGGNLEELLVACGGDESVGFVWKELREASFSYNNLESIAGRGLEFTPFLQVLDLSHNRLKDASAIGSLHSLKHLNLSYNQLERLPKFSEEQSNKLQSIVIKSNYIEDLAELVTLMSLQVLDVSSNCLIDHTALGAIPMLVNLQILNLEGNPLSCHPLHRKFTCRYLHANTASVKFILDRTLLSSSERMEIGTYHTNTVRFRRDINNSLSTSTPLSIRGRTPRKSSRRVRQAIITDTDDTDQEPKMQVSFSEESSEPHDLESSVEHLETKRQIENLREQYGDYWLHSKGGSTLVQDVLGMEKTPIPSSFYLDLKSDEPELESPNSVQTVIPENESEYTTIGDEGTMTEYNSVLETSYESTETTTEIEDIEDEKMEEEEDDQNSTLYIVQLEKLSGGLDDLFLCVNLDSKIIRERNSKNGVVREKWPLSILESCEKTDQGVLLQFDTVKRDKQSRRYIMEDQDDLEKLIEQLRGILDTRSLKDMNQTLYRCMRCSSEFTEEKHDLTRKRNQSALSCPTCDSTIVMEVEDEIEREPTPEKAEIALPQSPGSSIANERLSSGVVPPRLLKITADVHAPTPQSNIKQSCSATSLEGSLTGSRISAADSMTRRDDSDIEVLSDPSQDSIEVLAVLQRGSSLTPKRRLSSEERRLDALTSLLGTVTEMSPTPTNIATGLTESSSSDSLTDSICTAYEKKATSSTSVIKPPSEATIVAEEEVAIPEPKEAESVGILSSMLEGLWNASNMLSLSSPKNLTTNIIPPDNVDTVEFSYNNFTQLDHRVKLHLFLNIFDDETEELEWLLRAEILPHNLEQPFSGCLVLSTKKIYILKIDNVVLGDEPQQWLKKYDGFSIDRLQTVFTLPWKQGLGIEIRQVSIMGVESSISILCLLQDLMRTTNFLAHLSGATLPDTCNLVTKTSERTSLNMQQLILSSSSQPDTDFTIRLFHIFSECQIRENTDTIQDLKMGILLITTCDLILTQDSLTWMVPNSTQTPLICTTQQLSNLVEAERSGFTLKLNFMDEAAGKEESWLITTVSENAVDGIIEAVRMPWETLFSVQFQVADTSKT